MINGPSGVVDHFAVQIAKVYGAQVTAVCSSRNRNFVKTLGADHVLAYDKENIHQHTGKYDLVIDTHGNLSHTDYQRMGTRYCGRIYHHESHDLLACRKVFSKFPLVQFAAQANTKDLEILVDLIENGKIKVHIEKTYTYIEIPEAIKYIEAMRTKGKVAMVWESIENTADVDEGQNSINR